MKNDVINSPLIFVGDSEPRGSYVLRIDVREDIPPMPFGRFKRGKRIAVPVGQYAYVGSAMGRKGSVCLSKRLLRHASRSGDKDAHAVRKIMLSQFPRMGLASIDLHAPEQKNLKWNVDHLLDVEVADLVIAYIVRSPVVLEPAIGDMLENDAHTIVFEKGLGANDRPGSTYLLRVEAEQDWWNELVPRLETLRESVLSKKGLTCQQPLRE